MRKPQKILLGLSWLMAAVALTAFVVLQVNRSPQAAAGESQLETYFTVPPFELTNQLGQTVTDDTLAGQPYVVGLFFSTCGEACPMLTEHLQYVQDALGDAPVRIVRITVDPAYDTPERLIGYAQAVSPQPDKLHLLTGEADAVFNVIKGFRISASPRAGDEQLPQHGNTFLLVDGQGRVRGVYDGLEPQEMQNLLRDIRQLTE